MSQEEGCTASNVTSPRATDEGTHPGDRLPADGRDLLGEVPTFSEVSATPDYDSQYDVSVNLQSLTEIWWESYEALQIHRDVIHLIIIRGSTNLRGCKHLTQEVPPIR